jgi:CPA2 family monovalent cation:H+ antiporter-2
VFLADLNAAESITDPNLAATQPQSLGLTLAMTLGKVLAFVVLMLVVGKRLLPKMLWAVARTGSQELFTLTVIAAAVGVAFGAAKLFEVSFALGAFFAGMMMRESEFSHRAADESLPLRDAFAVLFFVSVGMLFDPSVVWNQPIKLLVVVAIIMAGKTLAAVALVLLFRYPLNTALTVGVSLAQIGEFSFILAGLGVSLQVLPVEAQSLILAAAFVSIAANSALFAAIEPMRRWILVRSKVARQLEMQEDPLSQLPMSTDPKLLSNQVVLVGYGHVGQLIAKSLNEQGIPLVVVEQNRECVDELRQLGTAAVSGDASSAEVLIQAHIARAQMLVITVKDPLEIHKMTQVAMTLRPEIFIVLGTQHFENADMLKRDNPGIVFDASTELANGMAAHVIRHIRSQPSSHQHH